MKERYYVNMRAQVDGRHAVHLERCHNMPTPENRKYLGDFSSCEEALAAAKVHYRQADGCYNCCRKCHASRVGVNVVFSGDNAGVRRQPVERRLKNIQEFIQLREFVRNH